MCPERQQHNIFARSHAPPISLPTTANGLQALPTTSSIDIYEGTLHAALLSHLLASPYLCLYPFFIGGFIIVSLSRTMEDY